MSVATPTLPRARAQKVEGKPLRHYVGLIVRYALLVGIGIVMLTPFILAAIGSFKTNAEIIAWPPKLLPEKWLAGNWA